MVKQCTAQHIYYLKDSYGVRNYWFTFLVEANGVVFIIRKRDGFIIQEVDKNKVKFRA